MNLEKFNVVELNAQEVRKTEGGFIPWPWLLAAAVIVGVGAAGVYNGYTDASRK